MPGSVIVSIHDVSPSSVDEVRRLLAALDAMGVGMRVLKVIPCELGERDICDYPELTRLLRQEQDSGSEIILHGYTHRAAGQLRGPWLARARARAFAGNAAEFLTLDEQGMRERVERGKEMLVDAGLEVRGFCAPAWLSPSGLRPILQWSGFRYLVSMASVEDLSTGRHLPTPWLGYMGAGAVQERLIAAGGRLCILLSSGFPVVKVFFHPSGAPNSAACRQCLSFLSGLLTRRRPTTYARLFDR